MKSFLSLCIATLLILSANSQNTINALDVMRMQHPNFHGEKCKADILHQKLMQTDPAYAQKYVENEMMIQNYVPTRSSVLTVPVVVHVIHLGEAEGTGTNISDAQIHSAINNLNDAYRGNGGYATDMEIEFCLASRDPSGNPTSGINRVDGSGTSDYATEGITNDLGSSQNEVSVKALSKWSNADYYNIWVVSEIDGNDAGGGTQGYAYYPGAPSSVDGAVVMFNSFGYDPTGAYCYNLKSYTNYNVTLIHELGHGLNLRHTFQGDDANSDGVADQCPDNTDCSTDGDAVCDTDPHQRDDGDCGDTGNTCAGAGTDLGYIVQNFMAYSSDQCQTVFTAGQKTRARAALTGSRASLLTSLGCSNVPVSNFSTCTLSGCAGSSIDFMDNSSGGATSWSWSFTGGTPSTSTDKNPTITYAAPGTYQVVLTATNGAGAGNTETKVGYITIYSAAGSTCQPTSNNPSANYGYAISNVTFNTINNTTSTGVNGEYQDLTCGYTTEVTAGQSYDLDVTINSGGSGGAEFRAYIDYNNDGAYDDATELVNSGSIAASSSQTFSTTETIPLTAVTGSLLRLRVTFDYGTVSTGCESPLVVGDVEDYGVLINAAGSPPVADFSVNDQAPCAGTSINFTDASTNSPTSWLWDFGDGNSSTSQNPSHTYASAGDYTVTLTATNASGSDPEVKTDYISAVSCGPTTQLTTADCGSTPSSFDSYIYADPVNGATRYEFQFTNTVTSSVYTYQRHNWVTTLSWQGTADLNATFDVQVRVKVGGTWGAFGPVCQITSPGTLTTTSLTTGDCGVTLGSFDEYIYAHSIDGADRYEFRFTNTVTSDVFTYQRSNWAATLALAGIDDGNATFDVDVRARVNGTWNNFGAVCQVTSPVSGYTTNLRAADCGITAGSFSQYLFAEPLTGATRYEFKFTNTVTSDEFVYARHNWVTTIAWQGITDLNTTFDVEVRAKLNGSWINYGSICQVTTPASAIYIPIGQATALKYGLIEESEIPTLNTYPNPNNGESIFINASGLESGDNIVSIMVLDMFGKTVYSESYSGSSNELLKEINFNNKLAKGMYLLQVSKGTSSITNKVFVE